MKKRYLLLSSLALLSTVVACGETSNSSDSPSGGISQSETISQGGGTSSYIPTEDEYVIAVRTYVGITITPSKTKAKKGETITLSVVLDSGYTLNHLYLNGSESALSKIAEDSYSFVMPNQSAVITAELSVSGEVTVTGTVPFALTKDDATGIYSAKGITITDKAYLSYVVNGKELNTLAIDNTKCFADMELNYGTGKTGAFALAGNATYDFFYNPNNGDTPCYVVRTNVTEAPKNVSEFQSLFSGTIQSEPTTWPSNVSKVTYKNKVTNEEYKWNNYEKGSLGISKVGEKTSYVYKSIDGDVYTVVDNYIEGTKGTQDQTKNDDNEAFSGKYKIVDALDEFKASEYLSNEAEFDAHHYSHDVESLDFGIHYGYRTGFDKEWVDSLYASDIAISSTKNIDGGFTTTIESYKSFDESMDTTLSSTLKYHIEYKIEFTFNKAGAPVSGSYEEVYYSSDAFDIYTGEFLKGGQDMGVTQKAFEFTYSYGQAKDGGPSLDLTPYFVSELNNLKIHNETTAISNSNVVQQNDLVNNYLSFDAYPETALDGWQYKIISSSDPEVIGPRSSSEPLKYKAYKKGTAILTIGNGSTNHLTREVNVEVLNTYLVDGFYMTGADGKYDEEVMSDYIYVRAGYKKQALVKPTSRNTGKYVEGFDCGKIIITSSKPELLTVTVDENNIATFNATNATTITEKTTVTCNVTCDYMEENYTKSFTVYLLPFAKPTESLFTTWTDAQDDPEHIVSLTLKQYVEGDSSTLSTLTVDGKTYNIKFTYNEDSGKMTASSSELSFVEIYYDYTTDQIGVCAVGGGSWSGQDSYDGGSVLLGSATIDDEDTYVAYTYYFLDRA